MPSHYLNQCWNIVNWTLIKKIQWNLNHNYDIFIQENTLESVVYETVAICLSFSVLKEPCSWFRATEKCLWQKFKISKLHFWINSWYSVISGIGKISHIAGYFGCDYLSMSYLMLSQCTHCVNRSQLLCNSKNPTEWMIGSCAAESRVFLNNHVNTMAADALAPCVARASAAMIFIIWNKDGYVFLESEFQ